MVKTTIELLRYCMVNRRWELLQLEKDRKDVTVRARGFDREQYSQVLSLHGLLGMSRTPGSRGSINRM